MRSAANPHRDIVDRSVTNLPSGGVLLMASKRMGPGPSSVLLTPDRAGNVVGVDPHKRSVSATVVDPRGGIGQRAFPRLGRWAPCP